MRYPFIIFDLFRTVVLYRKGTVTNKVHQPHWRGAMLDLSPRLLEAAPGLDVERFVDALVVNTQQMAAARGPELREVAMADRYLRTLQSIGIEDADPETARRLSEVQVEAQMAGTFVPDEHYALLERLLRDRKLALVSNYDHSAGPRAMLKRHDLERYFSHIVISIEHGRRKPHVEIFRDALAAIGADPERTLHVGDSFKADVKGAQASGIDVAWINPAGTPLPDGAASPTYEIRKLIEVAEILDVSVDRRGTT